MINAAPVTSGALYKMMGFPLGTTAWREWEI